MKNKIIITIIVSLILLPCLILAQPQPWDPSIGGGLGAGPTGGNGPELAVTTFYDKAKIGIPLLLQAIVMNAFGALVEGKELTFQIRKIGIVPWTDIDDDGIDDAITNLTTDENGVASVYFTATQEAGNYEIRVKGENVLCWPPTPLTIIKPNWLFIVYLCADNDLEAVAVADLVEMQVGKDNDNVSIALLLDGNIAVGAGGSIGWNGTKYIRITKNGLISNDFPKDPPPPPVNVLGEANMGDPNTLKWFIDQVIEDCDATHKTLVFHDHGRGWRKETISGKAVTVIPQTRIDLVDWPDPEVTIDNYNAVCFDWHNQQAAPWTHPKNSLSISEIKRVMAVEPNFNIISFNACLMSSAEILYELQGECDYVTASEDNMDGIGLNYDEFLKVDFLKNNTTPHELAFEIVDKFELSGFNKTYASWKMSDYAALNTKITAFANRLIFMLPTEKAIINTARTNLPIATNRFPTPPHHPSWDPVFYIDLRKFCINIIATTGDDTDPNNLKDLAIAVRDHLSNNNFRIKKKGTLDTELGYMHIYFPESTTGGDWNIYYGNDHLAFVNNPLQFWDDFLKAFFEVNKVWTGTDATNPTKWDDDDNWNPLGVPANTDEVVIPNTANQPIIDVAGAVAKSVLVLPGATLTIQGNGDLTIAEKLTNSGTINCTNTAKLIVNGRTTVNAGTISLANQSIMEVKADFQITNVATLTTTGTTEIKFFNGSKLICDGTITANGTKFLAGAVGEWAGIQIINNDNVISFTNCTFEGGIAIVPPENDCGGAVYLKTSPNITFTTCTFQMNQALNGGGLCCIESSPTIDDCNFFSNSTSNAGGGIYMQDCANPTISESEFQSNDAFVGGGIYCSHSNPEIDNTLFINHIIDGSGGGIFCTDNSNGKLVEVEFISNHVTLLGAASYFEMQSNFIIEESILHNNNIAQIAGGGIYLDNSSPQINDCTIEGNSANNSGGGICCINLSNPTIRNVRIQNNSALVAGGGIYFAGSSPVLHNLLITGNDIDGISCLMNSNPKLYNTTITGNGGWGVNIDGASAPFLYNCIVWNGAANSVPAGLPVGNVLNSDIEQGVGNPAYPGAGNINEDPFFGTARDVFDIPLLIPPPDPPADPGTINHCVDMGAIPPYPGMPGTDIAGDLRVVKLLPKDPPNIDMGCFEVPFVQGFDPEKFKFKQNLDGPYDEDQEEMKPAYFGAGILPLNQPYNTAPWYYSGSESVTSIPNPDIIDWVLVELRDAIDASSAAPSTMIAQQAAFILRDGSIVGMDGYSDLTFPVIPTNRLFAVIYHRNHIPVMSAYQLTISGGIYDYDFTDAVDKAYNSGQKFLESGVYGMYGGDANCDGFVNSSDGSTWTGNAGTTGYLLDDLNLDGQVDNKDKNDDWLPNLGAGSQVPQ